jgi:DNA-binding CsgD family transcriptional regulator
MRGLLARLVEADTVLRTHYGLHCLPPTQSLQVALDRSDHIIEVVMGGDDIVERGALDKVAELLAVQLTARHSVAGDLVHSSRAVTGSVRRLRNLGTGANLPRQMCAEVVDTAPFELAVFSTVDEVGWQAHVQYPANVDRPPVSLVWEQSPVERQSVCAREVLVTGVDCAATPKVAAYLATTDYVVAPVIAESEVVGLLHASRQLPMVVDDVGAALLTMLASTFGAAYEREVWSHRVHAHRRLVSARVAQLIQSNEDALGSELEIDSPSTDLHRERYAPPMSDLSSAPDWLLTARESEVMNLIAEGASNAEIADGLFIATETVKSHVKHILRKLGAVNRSEAISLYLDHG